MNLFAWIVLIWAQRHPVVCIDPGHPSEIGRGSHGRIWTEIHANWVMAISLKSRLEKNGVRVLLTKTSENEFVSNRHRAEKANDGHAQLLVRLHCDGGLGGGYAVYFPDREGHVGRDHGPTPEIQNASRRAANSIHDALKRALKGRLEDGGLRPDAATRVGASYGALIGSIYAKEPVVLVEMVTLANRQDERFIISKTGRKLLEGALVDGILEAIRGT